MLQKTEKGYIIISGHRRFRAFKRLHRKTIPSIIRVKTTIKDFAIDLAVENCQRKELTPIERSRELQNAFGIIKSTKKKIELICSLVGYVKDIDARGGIIKGIGKGNCRYFSEQDICECRRIMKLLSVSHNTVLKYLRLLTLPKVIQRRIVDIHPNEKVIKNEIGAGNIPSTMGYELSRVKGNSIQKELYNKAVEDKLTTIEIRGMIDELLESGKVEQVNQLGTSKRRIKDYAADDLIKRMSTLASKMWNFRKKFGRMKMGIDKIIFIATMKRMKNSAQELINTINNYLESYGELDWDIKSIKGEKIEVDLKKCNDGRDTVRFTFPTKQSMRLRLNPSDKLILKIDEVKRKKHSIIVESIQEEIESAIT